MKLTQLLTKPLKICSYGHKGELIQKNLAIEREAARIALASERTRKTDEISRLKQKVRSRSIFLLHCMFVCMQGCI